MQGVTRVYHFLLVIVTNFTCKMSNLINYNYFLEKVKSIFEGNFNKIKGNIRSVKKRIEDDFIIIFLKNRIFLKNQMKPLDEQRDKSSDNQPIFKKDKDKLIKKYTQHLTFIFIYFSNFVPKSLKI